MVVLPARWGTPRTRWLAATNGAGGAFGRVTEGMDVVRKIFAAPVSATKGEGVMRGQMLDPTVKIIKAERVKS